MKTSIYLLYCLKDQNLILSFYYILNPEPLQSSFPISSKIITQANNTKTEDIKNHYSSSNTEQITGDESCNTLVFFSPLHIYLRYIELYNKAITPIIGFLKGSRLLNFHNNRQDDRAALYFLPQIAVQTVFYFLLDPNPIPAILFLTLSNCL